jgi:hypothetical protein
MRICLHLDPSRLLRWQLWLADALTALPGNEVGRAFSAHPRPLPTGSRLLLDLERLLYGCRRNAESAADGSEAALLALRPLPAEEADVVVDLSGDGTFAPGQRVLKPLFNGIAGEVGIMAAVAQERCITVDVHDTARPGRPWTARPASSDREVFTAGLNGTLSCTVALILKALHEETGSAAADVRGAEPAAPGFGALPSYAFAAGVVTAKAVRLLDILARGGRCWRIAWRTDEAGGLLDHGKAAFRVIHGDVDSYFADPFPFRHQGKDFNFAEKYLYEKDKGCIAVVPLDGNGRAGEPRVVLEEAHHLSYPFVFERAGQIWMIPESGADGNVVLYRAEKFPHRWTREGVLMDGIEGYDTTPLFDQGKVWFFVSQRLWRSSSWDVLNIYQADGLTGPWKPHAKSPALIDASLSRPAGDFIHRPEGVVRPVQDCAHGYGRAVTFCRIDALSGSEFAQTPVGRLLSGSCGCHTYNRRSGIEVVDLFDRPHGPEQVELHYVPFASEAPAPSGEPLFSVIPDVGLPSPMLPSA